MKHGRSVILLTGVLATIAVVYSVFSFFIPYILDDLNFQSIFMVYNGGSSEFSVHAWYNLCKELYLEDNGRLANVLSPIATMYTPRVVFSALSGLAIAFMFFLMTVLSGIPRQKAWWAVLFLWAASIIFLPWRNSMMVHDYLLNYIYSSVAVFCFLYVLSIVTSGRRLSGFVFFGACLLAVVAGVFHESLSLGVSISLVAYAAFRRFRLPVQWWTLAVIFGLGTLYVVLAPGIWIRAGREISGRTFYETVVFIVTTLPGLLCFGGVLVLSVFVKILRNITFSLLQKQIFFIAALTSFLTAGIAVMVNSPARSGWFAEIMAMVCLASYLPFFNFRPYRKTLGVCAAIVYVVLCVFFFNVLRWQHRFLVQHDEIMDAYGQSATGTVFYDIIPPEECRATTLFLPMRIEWVTSFNLNSLNDILLQRSDSYLSVVPTDLAEFSEGDGDSIAGNENLRWYKGHIVGGKGNYKGSEEYDRRSDDAIYSFRTDRGTVYPYVKCFRIEFTDRTGAKRMYVWPWSEKLDGRVVSAEFIDYFT